MSSNPEIFAKSIFVLLALGGGLLYTGFKRRARARLIEDTPRSKLETAPQGLVEIEGFAWPDGDKINVNVSGEEVVFYELQLQRQEKKGSGKNRRTEWVTVFTHKHDETFYLCDPTGLAVIDPVGAEFDLKDRQTTMWRSLVPSQKERAIQLIGVAAPDDFPPKEGFFGLFAKTYRIVEREIRVGTPFYVSGELTALADPPMHVSGPGLTRFFAQTMDATTRQLKKVDRLLDSNNDGRVTSDEARNGYATAAKLARAKAKTEPSEEKTFPVWGLLQNSGNHRLFLADDHEVRLVEKMQKFTWLQIGSGVTCLAVAICMVLPRVLPESKSVARPARVVSEKEMNRKVHQLHSSCLTGHQGDACERLLNLGESYSLSSEYLGYYRQEACRVGLNRYCDHRQPASPDTKL